jgi:hypothetical protein
MKDSFVLLAAVLFNLGVWIVVGFVVVHFVMKFW